MNTQACLALLAPCALVAVVFALMFAPVPPESRDMLNIALGALIVQAKEVYGFEFGSSRGSREKTAALVRQAGRDGGSHG